MFHLNSVHTIFDSVGHFVFVGRFIVCILCFLSTIQNTPCRLQGAAGGFFSTHANAPAMRAPLLEHAELI